MVPNPRQVLKSSRLLSLSPPHLRVEILVGLALVIGLLQARLSAQELEYSGGASALIYQTVYSMDATFALEGALRGSIAGSWKWQAGARAEVPTGRPEFFGRLLTLQHIGAWEPFVGIELGWTGRARFGDGSSLLREARRSMEDGISPFYAGVVAAPISFDVGDGWRVSALEVQFGTHLADFGRTARLQACLISIGARR